MAYVKQIWTDRQVERPLTFVITENVDGTSTLIPSPGTVTQDGTLITADRMNHIEEGIAGLDSNITALEGAIETANSNINTINTNISNINKNLDTKKSKGDFVVLTGTISMPEKGDSTLTGSVEVSYPSGFTKDNCAVISLMGHNTTHTDYWSTTINSEDALSLSLGNGDLVATLKPSSIRIMSNKPSDAASRKDVTFKLVLMKIN